LAGGLTRAHRGEVARLADRSVVVVLAEAAEVGGLRRDRARDVTAGDQERGAPLAGNRAIEQVKRLGDRTRAEHVINRDRPPLVHDGIGVPERPLSRRHRHGGELLARGAALVHVACGRQA
jgi:hypothetical protein